MECLYCWCTGTHPGCCLLITSEVCNVAVLYIRPVVTFSINLAIFPLSFNVATRTSSRFCCNEGQG